MNTIVHHVRAILGYASPVVAVLSVAGDLAAQVASTPIPAANAPSARQRAGFALDEARDRFVLFGGLATTGGNPSTLDDTWLFDGTNWVAATGGPIPGSRQWAGMAYDRQRQRVVLFGGMRLLGGASCCLTLGDTWEWDGNSWAQIATANSPPPRSRPGFCYDAARGQIVMFGGYHRDAQLTITHYDDTWLFDGTNWTRAVTATQPSIRSRSSMVYDSVRGRVLLAGGVFDLGTGNPTYHSDMWEWDGVAWTQLVATHPSTAGEAMVFDEARGRAVRFPGFGATSIDEWDGSAWQARVPAPSVGSRAYAGIAYDRTRARIVGFGGTVFIGCCQSNDVNDTWEYGPVDPATFATFGAGCAGSAGVPELTGAGLPWLTATASGQLANVPVAAFSAIYLGESNTSFGSNLLPLDLGPLGAPGCAILAALRGVVTTASGGGVVPWTIVVPNDLTLLGRTHYMQGVVLDPVNALGVTLSNGLALTPGAR